MTVVNEVPLEEYEDIATETISGIRSLTGDLAHMVLELAAEIRRLSE